MSHPLACLRSIARDNGTMRSKECWPLSSNTLDEQHDCQLPYRWQPTYEPRPEAHADSLVALILAHSDFKKNDVTGNSSTPISISLFLSIVIYCNSQGVSFSFMLFVSSTIAIFRYGSPSLSPKSSDCRFTSMSNRNLSLTVLLQTLSNDRLYFLQSFVALGIPVGSIRVHRVSSGRAAISGVCGYRACAMLAAIHECVNTAVRRLERRRVVANKQVG